MMVKQKQTNQNKSEKSVSDNPLDNSNSALSSRISAAENGAWVTDKAWITGLTGVAAIVLLAIYFHYHRILDSGLEVFGYRITETRQEGMIAALVIVALCMGAVEVVRLWQFYRDKYIQLSPLIKEKKYSAFLFEGIKQYLYLVLLFWLSKYAYQVINEYGFKADNAYYRPWFLTLEFLWSVFLYLGLPYILVTRAFKYDPINDKKTLATLIEKITLNIFSKLKILNIKSVSFSIDDRRAALGFAVKFFFCPVMTVFFFDNFGALVNNFDYLFAGFVDHWRNGTYTQALLNKDLGNVAGSLIFTIDVGLAWVGYVLSSRWLDNQTVSAEPTLLGWTVCLLSYPPFRVIGGWFVTGPGEELYTQLPNPFLVTLFGSMMTISYFLYMLPTIWFGVRFSNLTHRGIIRTGPFALVRHPAYAAKNFAWWCVGFPAAIYVMFSSSFSLGLTFVIGLIFLSSIYYARAITEEQHLSFDPDYIQYCKQVKYRFIPGLI